MKKKYLSTCAIVALSLFTYNSNAQNWQPNSGNLETDGATNDVIIHNNLGIGTTNLPNRLNINGDIGFDANSGWHRHIITRSPNYGLAIYSGNGWHDGSGILLNGVNNTGNNPGAIDFTITDPSSGGSNLDAAFTYWLVDNTGAWNTRLMTMDKRGHVGIGALSSDQILNLNGDISFEPGAAQTRVIHAKNSSFGLALWAGSNWTDGSGIYLNGHNNTGNNPGGIDFVATPVHTTNTESAFSFWGDDWTTRFMSIDKRGYVGIGAPTSDQILNINGDISFEPGATQTRVIHAKNSDFGLALWAGSNWTDGSGIYLNGHDNTGNNPGGIDFVATPVHTSSSESAFSFWGDDWTQRLVQITKDNQVIIGNVPAVGTQSYKLYVETGILTEKLKVAKVGTGNWSDYVFAKDYKLKTLKEVETFINNNSHLPDVPSATDVENNGYDVTQMDATLLQKIEELTLYVIEQQKQIDALKSKLNK